jgi:ABC-type transport system involved in multi-copper enzyme maturation permease subunit
MIRAIIWKDWRENRAKYAAYWLAFNAPILLVAVAVGLSAAARTPFADLSDSTVLKYLPLTLGEPVLLATAFLLVTGFLGVAAFRQEIEDSSLFFVFEQPLSRQRYVAMKVLIGGIHVALAACFATLFATAAAYAMMLLSGKVTWAGSVEAFYAVFAASARAVVWCSLISLIVFTGSALVSSLASRWWMAAAGSVAIAVLLVAVGGDFFSFTADIPDGDPMSIGMGFSSGSAQWVTVSRALHLSEVNSFAHWRALPLLVAVLVTLAFFAAMPPIYARKDLK